MNILILSRSHPFKAAGIVAYDLMKSLKKNESYQVIMLVKEWDKYPDNDIVTIESYFEHLINISFHFFYRIWRKVMRIMFKGFKTRSERKIANSDLSYIFEHGMDINYYSTRRILNRIGFKPDVILVLFMPGFISFKNLYEISYRSKAVVLLYLMDMAPMTGGCHYAWDCKGYMTSCGNCPALYSNTENDQSRKNWKFKKDHIRKTNLTVIAATEYQYRQLQLSSLFEDKKKKKILLSIDMETFKPTDRTAAREYFKLPHNKKVLFFGAVSNSERRKGLKELVEALKKLKTDNPEKDVHLAIAGKVDEMLIYELPYEYTLLGNLSYQLLSKAFNASDVFLCPSIEDSGPMMINQSVMCGTPVVSFEMGVALDLVINEVTGYRAKIGDCHDFARGIQYLIELNQLKLTEISYNCRNLGMRLCNPETQSEKFLEIINKT